MIQPSAPVDAYEEIGSTSDEARARAERGDFGPVWITAKRQTAGRGRRGRPWSAPPGNLAATYLGATHEPPATLALLSFVAALAVAHTADVHAAPGRATLKWPNDVLLDGRKCSGILLESGQAGQGRIWFALGVGLNLAHAPEVAAYPAAAFSEFAPPPSPEAAFATLREALLHWSGRLTREGFAPVREAWLARAHRLGGTIGATVGEERIEGVFEGLNETGALLLTLPDGSRRVIPAGEVFFPDL